jgi:hypothetical protein
MHAKHHGFVVYTLIVLALTMALKLIWDGYTNGARAPWWVIILAAAVVMLIADQLEQALARRHARRARGKAAGL